MMNSSNQCLKNDVNNPKGFIHEVEPNPTIKLFN